MIVAEGGRAVEVETVPGTADKLAVLVVVVEIAVADLKYVSDFTNKAHIFHKSYAALGYGTWY